MKQDRPAWEELKPTVEQVRVREREDRERHKQMAAWVLQSEQCKYVRRGSKGDVLGFRWHFCHRKEGHAGPHKDHGNRDFRSELHVSKIRKGQMPCEFVKSRERTPWERSGYLRCFRIEGHFGLHCDEYGGRFQSSLLDTDVFIYLGRWPVRTDPFPAMITGKLE